MPPTLMNRIRNDFRLALLVLFGVITVVGITPFAVYHFMAGQYLVGLIDLGIVACIAVGSLHAARTGRSGGATLFLAVTYSAGCVAVAHLAGLSGLLWVYPVMVANFMLARQRQAVAISLLVIAAVVASDTALPDALQKTMFGITAAVVCLFSWVFASRTEAQRLQLVAMASRDPLTGAQNRRGMDDELAIAMASSTRDGTPLGLLVFDLDHFKAVNDAHGHEAGDEVLVTLADVVHAGTRKGDRFFRLGGEEFALLIPGADDATLHAIAEKLRLRVQDEVACHGQPVTISIGAASLLPGEHVADWLARADAAMYRAKRTGRNRTVVDGAGDAAAFAGGHRSDPDPGQGA